MSPQLPLPPIELGVRVGCPGEPDPDPRPGWWNEPVWTRRYLGAGGAVADTIRASLPQDYSLAGKRVLDFGAGAGRVLRHFLQEAGNGEWHACDIDRPSIDWLKEHLEPPIHGFVCEEGVPLPFPDGHFDLIYAASVYSHLADGWAWWLAEHHRLLAPGGFLWASFLGPSAVADDPLFDEWDPVAEGRAVRGLERDWDQGGPLVACSPRWLAEHWSRGFEILLLFSDGLAMPAGRGHGFVLARRREGSVSAELLAAA